MLQLAIASVIEEKEQTGVVLLEKAGQCLCSLRIGNSESLAISSKLNDQPFMLPPAYQFMADLLNAAACAVEEVVSIA
jgi:bifunctional DNase/RNase